MPSGKASPGCSLPGLAMGQAFALETNPVALELPGTPWE